MEKKNNSTSVATTSHIETVGYSPWQVASLFVDAFALFYGLPHSDDVLPQWNWKIVTRPQQKHKQEHMLRRCLVLSLFVT